jgi:hypothetical protein
MSPIKSGFNSSSDSARRYSACGWAELKQKLVPANPGRTADLNPSSIHTKFRIYIMDLFNRLRRNLHNRLQTALVQAPQEHGFCVKHGLCVDNTVL